MLQIGQIEGSKPNMCFDTNVYEPSNHIILCSPTIPDMFEAVLVNERDSCGWQREFKEWVSVGGGEIWSSRGSRNLCVVGRVKSIFPPRQSRRSLKFYRVAQ